MDIQAIRPLSKRELEQARSLSEASYLPGYGVKAFNALPRFLATIRDRELDQTFQRIRAEYAEEQLAIFTAERDAIRAALATREPTVAAEEEQLNVQDHIK